MTSSGYHSRTGVGSTASSGHFSSKAMPPAPGHQNNKHPTQRDENVEDYVTRESKIISEDDCANNVIPVPNVIASILSKMIEWCKKHGQMKEDNNNSNNEEKEKELSECVGQFLRHQDYANSSSNSGYVHFGSGANALAELSPCTNSGIGEPCAAHNQGPLTVLSPLSGAPFSFGTTLKGSNGASPARNSQRHPGEKDPLPDGTRRGKSTVVDGPRLPDHQEDDEDEDYNPDEDFDSTLEEIRAQNVIIQEKNALIFQLQHQLKERVADLPGQHSQRYGEGVSHSKQITPPRRDLRAHLNEKRHGRTRDEGSSNSRSYSKRRSGHYGH
ncbi:SKP1-like protein 1B [Cinnamomum micranthum f. kanehirae]|uniref:SKP1-like protein 1B n=1 Tax=Cinnamomum micranthum f. kanehirae TaxID=337451 RepID=A0A3S3N787_9MAGN|nr:SKP1-like protein 1B [Cinnamomum micranthum f. kanehirae]